MLCLSLKYHLLIIKCQKHEESDDEFLESKKRNFFWIILRKYSSNNPDIPEQGGYVSISGEKSKWKTTINYFPVIHQPITEYKTVQECSRQAEEATKELGQEYTIIISYL